MPEPSAPTRCIGWDGLVFEVPRTWDLAHCAFRRRVTRIVLEDDYTRRLDAEWTQPRRAPETAALERGLARLAASAERRALETEAIGNLPDTWRARLLLMPDAQRFAVGAARLGAALVLVRVYSGPDDPERAETALRRVARSAEYRSTGLVPWRVYDVDLELPAQFRLCSTAFQAGRKEFVFSWRLRKLWVWQVSFADVILRERRREEWAAAELNRTAGLRGVRFAPGTDGALTVRRSRWHPLGHADEIGRWCFRYRARCEHDTAANRLLVWVYSYRRRRDLQQLDGRIGPFELRPPRDP